MPSELQEQLLNSIEKVFNYNRRQAENVYVELIVCMKKRQYITIYRMDDDDSTGQEDVDQAILRTLLRYVAQTVRTWIIATRMDAFRLIPACPAARKQG